MTPHEEAVLLNEFLTVLIVPLGGGLILSFAALWALHRFDRSWLWMLAGVPLAWLFTYINLYLACTLAFGIAIAIPLDVALRLVLYIADLHDRPNEGDPEPFRIPAPPESTG